MIPLLLLATVTLLTLVYILCQMRSTAPDTVLSWCCPHCDKGLRYPASRAGHRGSCPACKKRVTLPGPSELTADDGGASRTYSLKRRDAALVLRPAR